MGAAAMTLTRPRPAQITGNVPTISIDKVDGIMVYLSKDCLDSQIISAKSSEMNILVPQEDGDFVRGTRLRGRGAVGQNAGRLTRAPPLAVGNAHPGAVQDRVRQEAEEARHADDGHCRLNAHVVLRATRRVSLVLRLSVPVVNQQVSAASPQ